MSEEKDDEISSLKEILFNHKEREAKLQKQLAIAIHALSKVQAHGLNHYEDCTNSYYDDEHCNCGMEKTEKVVLDALTKTIELENELG